MDETYNFQVQIVTFRATSPQTDTRVEEMVVTEVGRGPVDAGATADYEQTLEVPALPPSNLNSCGIIDLEYRLKVEACIEGWFVIARFYLKLNLRVYVFSRNSRVN